MLYSREFILNLDVITFRKAINNGIVNGKL